MSKGSNSIREGQEIVFADGETRTIYPLTIRQLRKFMKIIKDLNTGTEQIGDEDIDVMVEASSIALEKVDADLAADRDALEDALDIRSFNQLLAAAMGTDPNA